jgi:signal transduction histidine kinase
LNSAARKDARSPADAPPQVVSARPVVRAVQGGERRLPSRTRLLLVEGDAAEARVLRRHLAETDPEFDVSAAGRLDAALELLPATAPDAVVADLDLPDSHGLDTVAALRAAASEVPIVVLTASDDPELALRALAAGASDCLVMSRVSSDLLARAVRYAIERNRLLAAERESRREAEAARDRAVRVQNALETSEKRRRTLLGSMLRAEEAERQRIAVELHDDTIQVMVAALVGMDACQATIERDDAGGAAESIARARATLASAVDRVRRMTFELRPPLLDAQGLGPAVTDLIDQVGAECGLETGADVSVRRYSPEIEILAYRTLRELIANVRKHASAHRLHLCLRDDGTAITCRLSDDGVGFDLEQIRGRRMRLHLGLDATIERVRIAGGSFTVDSGSGGTTVAFTIPIHREGDVRPGQP